METIFVALAKQIQFRQAILDNVEDVYTETEFQKAYPSDQFEVYTKEGIEKYLKDISNVIEKAEDGEDLLEKAKKNLAKLVKKIITNKAGKKQVVWVRRGVPQKKGKSSSEDAKVKRDLNVAESSGDNSRELKIALAALKKDPIKMTPEKRKHFAKIYSKGKGEKSTDRKEKRSLNEVESSGDNEKELRIALKSLKKKPVEETKKKISKIKDYKKPEGKMSNREIRREVGKLLRSTTKDRSMRYGSVTGIVQKDGKISSLKVGDKKVKADSLSPGTQERLMKRFGGSKTEKIKAIKGKDEKKIIAHKEASKNSQKRGGSHKEETIHSNEAKKLEKKTKPSGSKTPSPKKPNVVVAAGAKPVKKKTSRK